MPAEMLIFLGVAGSLGLLAIIAIYSDRRVKSFNPTPSNDRVFRCGKCSFVYTDDPDVERSRCPQCGKMNDAFEF